MNVRRSCCRSVLSQIVSVVMKDVEIGGGKRLIPAPLLCLVLILTALLPAVFAVAGSREDGPQQSVESLFHGSRLVRCLFQEKRLVLSLGGELHVLHAGESLPKAGMKLREANEAQIVLETLETRQLPSGISVPKAIVVLSPGEDGEVRTRIFSSDSGEPARVNLLPQSGSGSVTHSSAPLSNSESPVSPAKSESDSDGAGRP